MSPGRSGSRAGLQVNFTKVGLTAIEEQRRLGQLQMARRQQAMEGYSGEVHSLFFSRT